MPKDTLDAATLAAAWEDLQGSLKRFFFAIEEASAVLKLSADNAEESVAMQKLRQQIEQLEVLGRNLPSQLSLVVGAQGKMAKALQMRERLRQVQAEVVLLPYIQSGLLAGRDFLQMEMMLSTGFLRTSDLSRDPFLTLLHPWEAQICASIAERLLLPCRVTSLLALGAQRGICAGQVGKLTRVFAVEEDAALISILRVLSETLAREQVGVRLVPTDRFVDWRVLQDEDMADFHAVWIPEAILNAWMARSPEQVEAAALRWAHNACYLLLQMEESPEVSRFPFAGYSFEELTSARRSTGTVRLFLGTPRAIKIGGELCVFQDKRIEDFNPPAWRSLTVRKKEPVEICPLDRGLRRFVLSEGRLIRSYLNDAGRRNRGGDFRDHEEEVALWRELGGEAPFLPKLADVRCDFAGGHIVLEVPPAVDFVRPSLAEPDALRVFRGVCEVLRFFRRRSLYHNRLRLGHFLISPDGILLASLEDVSRHELEDSLAALFWLVVDLFRSSVDWHRWRVEPPDPAVVSTVPLRFQAVLRAILSAGSLDEILEAEPLLLKP